MTNLLFQVIVPLVQPEILNNGKAGILVPVGDTIGFADAIERILSDKTLQESLHAELKEHRTKFMAEENISALEQLF